jgi:MATE family multidrug resistance protein
MKITDTALLGHVSGKVLAASALSDLWTMWSLVLLDGRVLGVLVGGAVGAGNPKLAGIYLQISCLVVGFISVFVIFCWNFTEPVLKAYLEYQDDDNDEDGDELAHMAGYYSRVLSLAIPTICGFSQLAYFFAAQRILHPEVNASALGLLANLVFGLFFVLGWPPILGASSFEGFGFVACPIVTTVVSYLRLAIVLVVYVGIQKLHAPCWDGWKFSEFTWERIKTYCGLYFPAAASVASDFWRVTVMGAIAARLGATEVAVFNTSYRYDHGCCGHHYKFLYRFLIVYCGTHSSHCILLLLE